MRLSIFNSLSLKTRITLFTLLVFIAVIWLMTFIAGNILREEVLQLMSDQQRSSVAYLASEINFELEERLSELKDMAVPITSAMMGNAALLQTYLEQHPLLFNQFNAGAYVADEHGTAIASVPVEVGRVGVNYLFRDHVAAALQAGKSKISHPAIGKKLHVPVFALATPIRNEQGRVIGALVGVVNLDKPNFLDEFAKSSYGKQGYYLIADAGLRLIITATDRRRIMQPLPESGVHALIDRQLQGYDQAEIMINPLGVEVLSTAKRIPVANWLVVASLPTQEVYAPIQHTLHRLQMWALILTLLSAGSIWWMIRCQLYPMLTAMKRLSGMSASAQNLSPLPVIKNDEIGQLVGGFNALLEVLGKREMALQASETKLSTLFQKSPIAIALSRLPGGEFVDVNETFILTFGFSRVELIGKNSLELGIYRDAEARLCNISEVQLLGSVHNQKTTLFVKSGEARIFLKHLDKVIIEQQTYVISSVQDITEQERMEFALRESETKFRAISESAYDAIVMTGPDGRISFWNPAAERMFGYSTAEAVGQSLHSLLMHPDFPFDHAESLTETQTGRVIEVSVLRKGGEAFPVAVSFAPMRINEQWHGINIFRDITERKQAEAKIRNLAFYDSLTQLPNRRLLDDRLQQVMAASARSNRYAAIMMLDLDNFKLLNDRHGHRAGDLLLVEVAARLRACVREVDTVGRFGGDEFVVILHELDEDKLASVSQARQIAEKICSILSESFQLTGTDEKVGSVLVEHRCTASIGVMVFIRHEFGMDELLGRADKAMYLAKAAGRSQIRFVDQNTEV